MTYATLEDFYDRLKAEAIATYQRRIVSVDPALDIIKAPGHGLSSGYTLRFEGTTLPAPLSSFTVYYAIPSGSDLFRVAATEGGSALDLTTAGGALLTYVVDIEASILRELARQGARIDACLKKRGVTLPLTLPQPDLADLELGLTVWPILLARGYTVNRESNPDQDYKVQWEASREDLADLCKDGGWLPPGVDVGVIVDAPSEAWDANARGWKDDRYGDEGI